MHNSDKNITTVTCMTEHWSINQSYSFTKWSGIVRGVIYRSLKPKQLFEYLT